MKMPRNLNQIIRIVIADDHQLFREGVKYIIHMEKDMEVVGECGDGIRVVELCNELKPDVVLMDINMPVENGVKATERICEIFPDIKVIILSIHDDENYVFETLRVGASGYLLKDMEGDLLVSAIRSVKAGHAYIHPRVTGKLIDRFRHLTSPESQGGMGESMGLSLREAGIDYNQLKECPLTRRQLDVLRLMAEGKSNKHIAEDLLISEKTVKNHVSSILQKMKVDDRTQAVVISVKYGWIVL